MSRLVFLALPCLFAFSACAGAQTSTNPAPVIEATQPSPENGVSLLEARKEMAARAEAACPSLIRFETSFGMSHCQCVARSVVSNSMDQADADRIATTLTKPGIIFRAAARNMRWSLSESGIKALDACTGG